MARQRNESSVVYLEERRGELTGMTGEDFLNKLMRHIHIEEREVDGRLDSTFILKAGGSSISLLSSGDIKIEVGRHLIIDREGLSFDKCDSLLIEEAISAYEEGEVEYDLFLMRRNMSIAEKEAPIIERPSCEVEL